jgi:hypothetical protein
MHALAQVLDRFSTSSAVELKGIFIPASLEGIYMPQILISKF